MIQYIIREAEPEAKILAPERFVPRKRTALDGIVWWCVFDTLRGDWSSYLCHGKHRTKKGALYAIERGKNLYNIG